MATVRYIATDVGAAVGFYVDQLGFEVVMDGSPGFAMLTRDDLRLLLNAPGAGGAGNAGSPEPGGWNRFQVEVDDLAATVTRLEAAGCAFRSGIVQGNGGDQALVEDPCGNVVELMQPNR